MVSANSSLFQVMSSNPSTSREKKERKAQILATDGATSNSFVFFSYNKPNKNQTLLPKNKLKAKALKILLPIKKVFIGFLFWLIIGFYSDYILPMKTSRVDK